MTDHVWKAYSHGMAAILKEGGIVVSSLLLKSYHALGLSDSEAMLLLQIMQFSEMEGKDFPTPEEMSHRMGLDIKQVTTMLARLFNDGFLSIDEHTDQVSNIIMERYNWTGWLMKAADWYADELRSEKKSERQKVQVIKREGQAADLFTVFEQEFGRLLSPMECETIVSWIDQDRYSEEIIRFALKEAVFAGKLSLRYIDRILIEWSRNRVTNAEEAKAHSQKFHMGRS